MTSNRRNILGQFGPLALLLCVVFLAAGCASTPSSEDEVAEESAGALTKSVGGNPEIAFQDSDIIPITRSPVVGGMSAKVTIVAFSDFQCPDCERSARTLSQVFKAFSEDTKVVFKQLPLSFHPQAEAAARASIAASRQGQFWEMHDWLFENQDDFREHADDFEEWAAGYAATLKLDVEKFHADFNAAETTEILQRDAALAAKLNVKETPVVFVNGERLEGMQPFDDFAKVVEAQRAQADAMIEGDNVPPNLYATLVAKNYKKKLAMVPGPAMKDGDDDDAPVEEVMRLDTRDLSVHAGQVRGPKDAKVTIFAFEDFECPVCVTANANLKEALTEVDDSVRVVFKHLPLEFHQQALPAAKAAIAAREQGKFWEMHDLIFERQAELKKDGIYAELAKSLGLNMKTFKADMAEEKYEAQIAADKAEGEALGVRGMPVFLINGTAVVGAKPTERFVHVIREALSQKQ